jgi:hypothetical protein
MSVEGEAQALKAWDLTNVITSQGKGWEEYELSGGWAAAVLRASMGWADRLQSLSSFAFLS